MRQFLGVGVSCLVMLKHLSSCAVFIVIMSSVFISICAHAEESELCRAEIEAAICWTNSKDFVRSALEPGYRRECLKGGRERFADSIFSLYRRLPPVFQSVVCGIDTIYIEQEIEAVAYAGVNGGRSAIGIRQEIIEGEISIEDLYSWKEQLIFKKKTPAYASAPELPRYKVSGREMPNSGLLFVLIHELSHLFDLKHDLQSRWSEFEWNEGRLAQAVGTKSMWTYRNSISYYGQGTSIYPRFAPNLYEALRESSFVSAYASTNPYEDFAETLSHLVMLEYYGLEIRVVIGEREVLNARQQLASPKMRWKIDFLRRLF